LKIIMEQDNRVPNEISFPKIDLIEHEQIMDTQTMRQEIQELSSTNKELVKEVETIKQDLLEAQNESKRLLGRNLIDRIFNRKW
jgi:archaellum component FlaC